MKVLIINGSPHSDGTTARALSEAARILNGEGIETEVLQVGNLPLTGCKACFACKKLGKCVMNDAVNDAAALFAEADGIIVGSPVYYSAPNGTLLAFLDRLFYSSGRIDKRDKVGAAVVCARRGGCTASFDVLNKYFSVSGMPIATSTYWNQAHGACAADAEKDLEGMLCMRNLARNMAFLMKSIALGKERYGLPEKEPAVRTSFINN